LTTVLAIPAQLEGIDQSMLRNQKFADQILDFNPSWYPAGFDFAFIDGEYGSGETLELEHHVRAAEELFSVPKSGWF
jgi:hypothetical protein